MGYRFVGFGRRLPFVVARCPVVFKGETRANVKSELQFCGLEFEGSAGTVAKLADRGRNAVVWDYVHNALGPAVVCVGWRNESARIGLGTCHVLRADELC